MLGEWARGEKIGSKNSFATFDLSGKKSDICSLSAVLFFHIILSTIRMCDEYDSVTLFQLEPESLKG